MWTVGHQDCDPLPLKRTAGCCWTSPVPAAVQFSRSSQWKCSTRCKKFSIEMMNRVVFELIYWQLMPQKCHKYVEGGTAPKEVWFYVRNTSTQFIFHKQRQKPCQLKCYDRPTWTLVSQTYARMSISLSNRTSSKVSSRQIDVMSGNIATWNVNVSIRETQLQNNGKALWEFGQQHLEDPGTCYLATPPTLP